MIDWLIKWYFAGREREKQRLYDALSKLNPDRITVASVMAVLDCGERKARSLLELGVEQRFFGKEDYYYYLDSAPVYNTSRGSSYCKPYHLIMSRKGRKIINKFSGRAETLDKEKKIEDNK